MFLLKKVNKMDIAEKIKAVLNGNGFRKIENGSGSLIHASVLIPLFETDQGVEVLFTERTHKVEHHKGQISFPGGAVEPDDKDYEETALRESHEEVGLLPADVEILGRLDDELTVASNFIIHPFVGRFSQPYDFIINRDEVEKIISVPFSVFMDENSDSYLNSIEFDTFTYTGPAYRYNGVTIWGATAIIMNKFIRRLNKK